TFKGRILLSGAGGAGGSPTGHVNLANFNTAMGSMFINTQANFNNHPNGALRANFYAGIGISSMTSTSGNVQNSAGPGQGNQGGAIQGEGPHQASGMLTNIGPNSQFTMTFGNAQSGVGFMVVDKFQGGGMRLKGYSGVQGNGNLIATATAPNNNYQRNNMVFMGVTDGGVNSIRSVVWNIPNNGGDVVGIDDIRFGATGIMNNRSYVQSIMLHDTLTAVGAARLTWFEHKPPGTDIIYNMTADGEHWDTVDNHTNHVFKNIGSQLMWNATLVTNDEEITPYIDKVVIEYDLVDDPEPFSPDSHTWQGSSTPELKWNFTDPDTGDHQSEYLVEMYDDENGMEMLFNSSWKNSTTPKHVVEEELEDGTYFWRVRTKDIYHAFSNFSVLKKIKIDVTKPVGNITIEGNALSVNEQLVHININASDNGSGIADMLIINDRGKVGPWEEFKTEKRISLVPSDGLKTIGVKFRDNAGIVSEIFNDTIYLDLRGPGEITVGSTTHPEPEMYYNSTLPVFSWDPPYEVAGIKGYSYMVDSFPLTEPTKVLYTQNRELLGTFPGEFSGLTDDTWYFHICASDIYDQWGNTSHFRFNIDTSIPLISGLGPDNTVWYNSSNTVAEAIFEDIDSYGLDVESIVYSYRIAGGNSFSSWTNEGMEYVILETGIGDNPAKVRAYVNIPLSEGSDNTIRWRITDLAGNGPAQSEKWSIKVDKSPVTFSLPVPETEKIFLENSLICGITVSDIEGSGVEGKTVEYSISSWGDDDDYFVNWTGIGNFMVNEFIDVSLEIEFEAGKNNYIRWRAMDAVGNGYSFSETYRIWVNSPPIPIISTPLDGESFKEGSIIRLNATGSEDNEGDELSYYWLIKGKSSKKTVFKGHGISTQAVLGQLGKFLLYLYVNDGHGFNESIKLDIEVVPKPADEEDDDDYIWGDTTDSDGDSLPDWWEVKNGLDPNDPNDATQEKMDAYDKEVNERNSNNASQESLLARYWWLIIIIGFLILLTIIAIIVVTARKKRKEKKTAAAQVPPPRPYHPYSQGQNMGVAPSGYGGQYGHRPPPYGAGSYPLALPPGPGAPLPRPAIQAGMPGSWGQQPTAYPPLPLPVGPQSVPASAPSYLLPSFTTDQGLQNMNLLALPPAADYDNNPHGMMGNDLLLSQQGSATGPVPEIASPYSMPPSAGDTINIPFPAAPAPVVEEIYQTPSLAPDTLNIPFGVNPVPGIAPPAPIPSSSPDIIPPDVSTGIAPVGTELSSYDDNFGLNVTPALLPPEAPPLPGDEPPTSDPISTFSNAQCHVCTAMNLITTSERPTIVTCASCGAQGLVTE
ncbi:MAG: hypothetical protein QGH39_02790, partial [Candidatus Thermoplasmatota archaeon]|nr:hypothetical protein [Candidatus Thermoplasmatota archaeon]